MCRGNVKKEHSNGKDIINSRLNELYNVTSEYLISLSAKGKEATKAQLKTFLDDYTNKSDKADERTLHGFITAYLQRNKNRINPSTGKIISYKVIREHERTYELLKEFEDKKNRGVKLDFDDITLNFYTDFTSFLQSLNLSVNTIAHKFQTLKTWLNEATERNINTNRQFEKFKAVLEDNENVYLTDKELIQMYDFNDMSESLTRLFLIGAFTGLRISDLTSITADNIKDGKLHIEQQKTVKPVTIPLHSIVVEIWNKYDATLPKVISNQKFK